MSRVVSIGHLSGLSTLPVDSVVNAEAKLPGWARAKAESMLLCIADAIQLIDDGQKIRPTAFWLFERIPPDIRKSVVTYERWLSKYKRGGLVALAPKHKGRQPRIYAWHARAYHLFRLRSQPSPGDIADRLRAEGHTDVTYERVRAFCKRIPADKGLYSAARLGQSYRRANHMPKKSRDVSALEVGCVWVADGHKVKILCRNRVTGNFYRLEMTPILDVRSNYWFATWFSKAESSATVVNVFCSVVRKYRKAPHFFYSDNGSGFKNERVAAMFLRIGTEAIHAKPGAPYSKGMGEAIFKFVINRLAKFAFPDAYCGEDITDDVIARYRTKFTSGPLLCRREAQGRRGAVVAACLSGTQSREFGRAPSS